MRGPTHSRSSWRQSSVCEDSEKQEGEKNRNRPVVILPPVVLQKLNARFLRNVDWNRVDMQNCVAVLRGESNAERERERNVWLPLTFPPSLHGLLVTVILRGRDKQFRFALLPSLTSSDRRFIVFKSAVFSQVSSTPNKSCFLRSPHYAARSGDRPFNTAL